MKKHCIGLAVALSLSLVARCPAQERRTQYLNARLSSREFRAIAAACAPDIPLATLRAIARAESAFHPYALSLDHPRRTAREQGFEAGEIFLARQPTDLAEARAWTHWLLERGRSVSIGLVQISTQHAADLGITVDQLFDPCTNLRAGARVLTAEYQRAAAVRREGRTSASSVQIQLWFFDLALRQRLRNQCREWRILIDKDTKMTAYPGPVSTHILGLTGRHSLLGQFPEQGIVVRNLRKKT